MVLKQRLESRLTSRFPAGWPGLVAIVEFMLCETFDLPLMHHPMTREQARGVFKTGGRSSFRTDLARRLLLLLDRLRAKRNRQNPYDAPLTRSDMARDLAAFFNTTERMWHTRMLRHLPLEEHAAACAASPPRDIEGGEYYD